MWPNSDAGSDDVSKGIRKFREANMHEQFYYHKNFSPEDFARVLNNTICCVGNSSSFIREAVYLGVPSVIVGDRQEGREHGTNVVFARYQSEQIVEQIYAQMTHGRYKPNFLFGQGDAGKKIADKLAELDF